MTKRRKTSQKHSKWPEQHGIQTIKTAEKDIKITHTHTVKSTAKAAAKQAPKNIRGKTQRNLPDQIVDLFLALIFIGDLKPGDRLPSELALTEILRVNRSSLRMAMRVLVRLSVIESNRGSGLIVLDYKTHAGINFITELIRISELDLGSRFILEMLDSAPDFFELLMNASKENRDDSSYVNYIATLEQKITYLKGGSSPHELAKLDIRMQDDASANFKNPLYRAAYNSLVPIRNYLMERYYAMGGDRLSHAEKQKTLCMALLTKEISNDEFKERFRQLLSDEINAFRDYLAILPKEPRLLVSPLQHYPELVSLIQK